MKKTLIANAEKFATMLLDKCAITKAPVDLNKIVRTVGIRIVGIDLSDDVSGFLIRKDDDWTIGYNSNHGMTRQHFTIAHELGHYILHRQKSEVFYDKYFWAVFRQATPSPGTDQKMEMEANAFAAALLMPDRILRAEIEKVKEYFDDDKAVDQLAKKFKVSSVAMTYRLGNLGLHL